MHTFDTVRALPGHHSYERHWSTEARNMECEEVLGHSSGAGVRPKTRLPRQPRGTNTGN